MLEDRGLLACDDSRRDASDRSFFAHRTGTLGGSGGKSSSCDRDSGLHGHLSRLLRAKFAGPGRLGGSRIYILGASRLHPESSLGHRVLDVARCAHQGDRYPGSGGVGGVGTVECLSKKRPMATHGKRFEESWATTLGSCRPVHHSRRLVCLSLSDDRLPARESRVLPIQRAVHIEPSAGCRRARPSFVADLRVLASLDSQRRHGACHVSPCPQRRA